MVGEVSKLGERTGPIKGEIRLSWNVGDPPLLQRKEAKAKREGIRVNQEIEESHNNGGGKKMKLWDSRRRF